MREYIGRSQTDQEVEEKIRELVEFYLSPEPFVERTILYPRRAPTETFFVKPGLFSPESMSSVTSVQQSDITESRMPKITLLYGSAIGMPKKAKVVKQAGIGSISVNDGINFRKVTSTFRLDPGPPRPPLIPGPAVLERLEAERLKARSLEEKRNIESEEAAQQALQAPQSREGPILPIDTPQQLVDTQSRNIKTQSVNAPQPENAPKEPGLVRSKNPPIEQELPFNEKGEEGEEGTKAQREEIMNNFIRLNRGKAGIWEKTSKENLADYSDMYLDTPISANFIKKNNKEQILDLILSINPQPDEKDNRGRLLKVYSPDLYERRFKELKKYMQYQLGEIKQLPQQPKLSAGRARLSKKEVLKILKNKTTKSNSAIKQLDTEIFKILNS